MCHKSAADVQTADDVLAAGSIGELHMSTVQIKRVRCVQKLSARQRTFLVLLSNDSVHKHPERVNSIDKVTNFLVLQLP